MQLPSQYFASQHIFIPPVLEAVTNNIANWVLAPIEECLGTQLMPPVIDAVAHPEPPPAVPPVLAVHIPLRPTVQNAVPNAPMTAGQLLHQSSSVQDGIYALRKAHMCSTPSLRSFPNVAFETVPIQPVLYVQTRTVPHMPLGPA